MAALLIMGLCVTGVAIPILAYKAGYHTGRSDAAKEMTESWEKQIEKAERRQKRDHGYES